MPKKPKDKRELAARALCHFHGVAANITFEGKPMWMSFLKEVDAVLHAIGWDTESGGVVAGTEEQPENKT